MIEYTDIEKKLSRIATMTSDQYITAHCNVKDRSWIGRLFKILGLTKFEWVRKWLFNVNLQTTTTTLKDLITSWDKEVSKLTVEQKADLRKQVTEKWNGLVDHYNSKTTHQKLDDAAKLVFAPAPVVDPTKDTNAPAVDPNAAPAVDPNAAGNQPSASAPIVDLTKDTNAPAVDPNANAAAGDQPSTPAPVSVPTNDTTAPAVDPNAAGDQPSTPAPVSVPTNDTTAQDAAPGVDPNAAESGTVTEPRSPAAGIDVPQDTTATDGKTRSKARELNSKDVLSVSEDEVSVGGTRRRKPRAKASPATNLQKQAKTKVDAAAAKKGQPQSGKK